MIPKALFDCGGSARVLLRSVFGESRSFVLLHLHHLEACWVELERLHSRMAIQRALVPSDSALTVHMNGTLLALL